MKRLFAAALASVALLAGASAASAATCGFGDLWHFQMGADVTATTACANMISGTDSDTSGGSGVVNVNTVYGGLFGFTDWTLDTRYFANDTYGQQGRMTVFDVFPTLQVGAWEVSSWKGIGAAMLTISGAGGFASYLVDISTFTEGDWSTLGVGSRKSKMPPMTQIALYTVPAAVPVPAAGLLLAGGLGALGLMRRRRRAA